MEFSEGFFQGQQNSAKIFRFAVTKDMKQSSL